jgi:hypothetical protein
VRSLRLDSELDRKIQRAATTCGESVSEFIRRAAEERAEKTLAGRAGERFADVVGAIHGGGGRARRTGEAFANAVADDCARR